MTTNDPDEIRRNIEQTRANISDDVNALADEARPSNVVKRQVADVKQSAQGLKEKIFGSADDDRYAPYDQPYGQLSEPSVGERVQHLGADARDAVQDAPRQLKQRTRGNPLAVGLVAFGLGALIGGLMPTTRSEQRLASELKDKAQPVLDQAQAAAKDAAEHLKPQAQQAVDHLKDSAAQSAQVVADEGQAQAQDVRDHAQASARDVRDHAQQATDEVRHAGESSGDPSVGTDYGQSAGTGYGQQPAGTGHGQPAGTEYGQASGAGYDQGADPGQYPDDQAYRQ